MFRQLRKKKLTLDYLDLAIHKHQPLTQVEQINLLIHSLRENYFAYGATILAKTNAGITSSEKTYVIPRIGLPPMKPDSTYKPWQQFMNTVFQFFDGPDRTDFIIELQLLNELMKAKSGENPTETFEQILIDFERGSGFAEVHDIKEDDGNNGILSRAEFRKILAEGHPLSDCGASANHGKLPHRLQFYILGHYFIKKPHLFFTAETLCEVREELANKYPEVIDETGSYPITQIISVFYRMLGSDDFNNSFDWKDFKKRRYALNVQYNGADAPDYVNSCDLWFQLFDRVGYAGYFSVPSTVGLLQKLGCFRSLPEISKPDFDHKKELKTIFDLTSRLDPNSL